ncbi:MAG: hypothetical protein HXS48_12440 [Theionarchaea archaeon]|nr:MAG: hypothetical protein AYK19_21575 [Theionarchaea archaeon DG-70-1]MBU7027736.1 hypothetical protein [Theionarchaea archaeon]
MSTVSVDVFGQRGIDIPQFGFDLNLEEIKSWIFGKRKTAKNETYTFIILEYLEPIIKKHIRKFQVDYNSPQEIKATLDMIFGEYEELDVVKEELSRMENLSELQFWNLFCSEVANSAVELREITEEIIKSLEEAKDEYPSEYALQSMWIDFFEDVRDSIQDITKNIREFKKISLYRTSKKNKGRFFQQVRDISLICLGVIPVVEKVVFRFEKIRKNELIQENEKEALIKQMALFDMILGSIQPIKDTDTSFDCPFHKRSFEERYLDPLMAVLLS